MISQVLKFVRQKNWDKMYFFMIYLSYGVNRQRKTLRSNLFVLIIFLKKIFGGHKSFLWATNTPVLDSWWCLLWVSKPEWAAFIHAWWRLTWLTCYTSPPEIHLWCNTCQPFGSQYGSQAILFHVPVSRYWWGSKLGSIVPSIPQSVRLGRCFTNCPMLARLLFGSLWYFMICLS